MKDALAIDDLCITSTKAKRFWEMTDDDIDLSDIPELTKAELAKRTVRFPNISQERLNGIRALVNREGIEKITRDNLELAKQRWREAEEEYDRCQELSERTCRNDQIAAVQLAQS